MSEQTTERLDKYLANHGVASRRTIKKMLKESIVTVNGNRVTDAGLHINLLSDDIRLNGKKIETPKLVYYLLNKPQGYVSTTADEYKRDNVLSLIPTNRRIYPIGRLDKDTTGLLILTNDGELTHKLTHPRYHIDKKYLLTIAGRVSETKLRELRRGVLLRDGITLPARVIVKKESERETLLELTIYEGRNRQIRRMCEALVIDLRHLERIAIGPITIGSLGLGKYRELTKEEIEKLQTLVESVRVKKEDD